MTTATGDHEPVSTDAKRRLIEIQGAASAAVAAVGRMPGAIPAASSDLVLNEASLRLASGIRTLQKAVERLIGEQASAAPERDRWQKRYHAVERERDSLQQMLVALKDKYEHLQRAYHELGQAHDRKVHESEARELQVSDASHRLETTLFLIDVMLRDDHDDEADQEDEA